MTVVYDLEKASAAEPVHMIQPYVSAVGVYIEAAGEVGGISVPCSLDHLATAGTAVDC